MQAISTSWKLLNENKMPNFRQSFSRVVPVGLCVAFGMPLLEDAEGNAVSTTDWLTVAVMNVYKKASVFTINRAAIERLPSAYTQAMDALHLMDVLSSLAGVRGFAYDFGRQILCFVEDVFSDDASVVIDAYLDWIDAHHEAHCVLELRPVVEMADHALQALYVELRG